MEHTREWIVQRLEEILKEILGHEAKVKESDLLKSDVGVDSLALVTLLCYLEDAFAVTFSDSDLDPGALRTVGDVIRLAEKYV